jgi:hypothetical protein
MGIFGPKKEKPRKPTPATEFTTALDAAISAARNSGVDIRFIYSRLENRAEFLRSVFVTTSGLEQSTEW